jgi:hypothetical protein
MIVGVRRAPARERDFSGVQQSLFSFFGKSHKSSQVKSVTPASQLQNLMTFESQTRMPKAPNENPQRDTASPRRERVCRVHTLRDGAPSTGTGHGTGGGGRVSSSSGLSRTQHSLTSTLLRDGLFASRCPPLAARARAWNRIGLMLAMAWSNSSRSWVRQRGVFAHT